MVKHRGLLCPPSFHNSAVSIIQHSFSSPSVSSTATVSRQCLITFDDDDGDDDDGTGTDASIFILRHSKRDLQHKSKPGHTDTRALLFKAWCLSGSGYTQQLKPTEIALAVNSS